MQNPFIYLFLISIFCSSCAVGYYVPNLSQVDYPNISNNDAISLGYRYQVLADFNHKRFAKKALRKNINVVAVEIENHTSAPLNVSEKLTFKVGNQTLEPINAELAYHELKQTTLLYLLYAPILLYVNGDGPIPVGLPISVYNIIKSQQSNKQLKNDLMQHDITQKIVPPHEKVHGYLLYRNLPIGKLSIEMRD